MRSKRARRRASAAIPYPDRMLEDDGDLAGSPNPEPGTTQGASDATAETRGADAAAIDPAAELAAAEPAIEPAAAESGFVGEVSAAGQPATPGRISGTGPHPGVAIASLSPLDPEHVRKPEPAGAPPSALQPGADPTEPWHPAPYPSWAFPLGTPGANAGRRRRVRLLSALGGAVLVAGIVLAAALVFQPRGSAGAAATGQSRATPSLGAVGAASASPSVAAPSASPIDATAGIVTATGSLAAGRGSVVFFDDFHDKQAGWPSSSKAGVLTFAYTAQGYVIDASGGTMHNLIYSPYLVAVPQLSMALTAKLTSSASGAGLGVTCRRGQGASLISYELLVLNDGRWFVERREGPPSLDVNATILSQGSSADIPGSTPITVSGMCATLSDGTTTRLALFVQGRKVADLLDKASLPEGGWLGGILVASRDTPAAATATYFEERDLSR